MRSQTKICVILTFFSFFLSISLLIYRISRIYHTQCEITQCIQYSICTTPIEIIFNHLICFVFVATEYRSYSAEFIDVKLRKRFIFLRTCGSQRICLFSQFFFFLLFLLFFPPFIHKKVNQRLSLSHFRN